MHDVPTHLEVKDKMVFGLTAGQTLFAAMSVFLSYSLVYRRLLSTGMPLLGALPIAAAVAALITSFAIIQPEDRSLDQWCIVLLHYISLPKVCLLAREEIVRISDDDALLELELQNSLWGGAGSGQGFLAMSGGYGELSSDGDGAEETDLSAFALPGMDLQSLFDPTGRFAQASGSRPVDDRAYTERSRDIASVR